MKNIFRLLAMLLMVAVVACKTDNPKTDVPADKEWRVELTSNEVMEFPAEGGEDRITWELKEVVRAASNDCVVSTEAQWIVLAEASANYCDFSVEANDGEAREGVIVITYGAQKVNVTVKQAGATDDPQPENWFAISVQEVHAGSAITQVTPVDGQMYYVMYLEQVSYLQDNHISTAEQLWEDDFYAFENNALQRDMNLKEYMLSANIVFQGAQRVQWNKVRPGVNSVLYVYGVKFSENGASYETVTDIAWTTIKPDYAPLQDVSFDLDLKVSGAEIELGITPENWDGHYCVKIVDANNDLYLGEGDSIDDEFMQVIADEWVAVCSGNLASGHSIETILDRICFKGAMNYEEMLNAYTLYTILVYPVAEYDGFVQVVAEPSYVTFSTEVVGESDMEINIEISNCYVRVADLKISSSNPEESYTMLITPTAYLPADYDNQTLLDYALGDFVYYTYSFKGEITSHLNTLYPETEYIVVAFGYSGGVVTTDVYTKVFKTQKEGVCELEVTDVIVGGPYRPSDLYNYDPVRFKDYTKPYYYDSSQYIVTLEVKTSEPTSDIFSYFVSEMDYLWGGYDTTFFDLLIDSCDPFAITEGIWDYGPHYACAAAFDYKGDVTEMWMSELYEWTPDDYRPIEEFIEKFEASPNMQVAAVRSAKR